MLYLLIGLSAVQDWPWENHTSFFWGAAHDGTSAVSTSIDIESVGLTHDRIIGASEDGESRR